MGRIKEFVLECAEEHMLMNENRSFDEAWAWATHRSLNDLLNSDEGINVKARRGAEENIERRKYGELLY